MPHLSSAKAKLRKNRKRKKKRSEVTIKEIENGFLVVTHDANFNSKEWFAPTEKAAKDLAATKL